MRIHIVDDATKKDLEKLLSELTAMQIEVYRQFKDSLFDDLHQFMVSEAAFSASLIERAVKDYKATVPNPEKLLALLRNNPLSIGKNGSGELLGPFIDGWNKRQIKQINGIIRQGWFEGASPRQISSLIKDTLQGQFKRGTEAIVRTAYNALSNTAQMAAWSKNSIITGWRFIAVLDSRTTRECASIDSLDRVYNLNEGPMPPRHISCRSTMIPAIKGQPPRKHTSYYDWLKTQPKGFVYDVLGPTRGKALLSGQISAKKFAALNLNKRFEPITIDEMKERDNRLNLNLFPDD